VVLKKSEKAPMTKKGSAPAPKAAMAASKPAAAKPRCGSCGHWSIATEYGVDDRSGYCDRWEKLTDRDYVCDEYVSREKFQAMQVELAEQHEEYLDEDTG
jgi:hypothetical protein